MKTAVEWFEKQLDDLDIEIPFSIFEQAKEIEKQQIINAYWDGNQDVGYKLLAEDYYEKTFNK